MRSDACLGGAATATCQAHVVLLHADLLLAVVVVDVARAVAVHVRDAARVVPALAAIARLDLHADTEIVQTSRRGRAAAAAPVQAR